MFFLIRIFRTMTLMGILEKGLIQDCCGAKNLALFQNQCKHSQLGKLIIFITGIMVHKGNNYSIKLRKYHFCITKLYLLYLRRLRIIMSIRKGMGLFRIFILLTHYFLRMQILYLPHIHSLMRELGY